MRVGDPLFTTEIGRTSTQILPAFSGKIDPQLDSASPRLGCGMWEVAGMGPRRVADTPFYGGNATRLGSHVGYTFGLTVDGATHSCAGWGLGCFRVRDTCVSLHMLFGGTLVMVPSGLHDSAWRGRGLGPTLAVESCDFAALGGEVGLRIDSAPPQLDGGTWEVMGVGPSHFHPCCDARLAWGLFAMPAGWWVSPAALGCHMRLWRLGSHFRYPCGLTVGGAPRRRGRPAGGVGAGGDVPGLIIDLADVLAPAPLVVLVDVADACPLVSSPGPRTLRVQSSEPEDRGPGLREGRTSLRLRGGEPGPSPTPMPFSQDWRDGSGDVRAGASELAHVRSRTRPFASEIPRGIGGGRGGHVGHAASRSPPSHTGSPADHHTTCGSQGSRVHEAGVGGYVGVRWGGACLTRVRLRTLRLRSQAAPRR